MELNGSHMGFLKSAACSRLRLANSFKTRSRDLVHVRVRSTRQMSAFPRKRLVGEILH